MIWAAQITCALCSLPCFPLLLNLSYLAHTPARDTLPLRPLLYPIVLKPPTPPDNLQMYLLLCQLQFPVKTSRDISICYHTFHHSILPPCHAVLSEFIWDKVDCGGILNVYEGTDTRLSDNTNYGRVGWVASILRWERSVDPQFEATDMFKGWKKLWPLISQCSTLI